MNTIILNKELTKCCGCGACAEACPSHAITMQANAHGFVYPVMDDVACVRCGKCVQVCSALNGVCSNVPMAAYAAVGANKQLVNRSASGGIFASLAEAFLQQGGMVAGAVLDCTDNGVAVYHILTENLDDLKRIQGSKYVQSDAWRCFCDVRSALKAGRRVLFSGTPCQVAAIRKFIGDHDNLYTIDLICHGVPSQQMLSAYTRILGKRLGGKIEQLCFRDKTTGKDYLARIEIKNRLQPHRVNARYLSFYAMFLGGQISRDSCYACPYTNVQRVGDITLGDYWGIREHHGDEISTGVMPQERAWSCMLVNTQKGKKLCDQFGNNLLLFASRLEWVASHNEQLNHPCAYPEERTALMKLYEQGGYPALEKRFIQKNGGMLRYYWRVIKNLYQNKNGKGSSK